MPPFLLERHLGSAHSRRDVSGGLPVPAIIACVVMPIAFISFTTFAWFLFRAARRRNEAIALAIAEGSHGPLYSNGYHANPYHHNHHHYNDPHHYDGGWVVGPAPPYPGFRGVGGGDAGNFSPLTPASVLPPVDDGAAGQPHCSEKAGAGQEHGLSPPKPVYAPESSSSHATHSATVSSGNS
jgi:hypothetical protein